MEVAKSQEDERDKTKAYILLGEAYAQFDQIERIIEDCEQVIAIAREQVDRKKQTLANDETEMFSNTEGKLR